MVTTTVDRSRTAFLKTWRRKFGLLTLLLACVFTMGWVSSLKTVNVIAFNGTHSNCLFMSGSGRFLLTFHKRFKIQVVRIEHTIPGTATVNVPGFRMVMNGNSVVNLSLCPYYDASTFYEVYHWGTERVKFSPELLATFWPFNSNENASMVSYWFIVVPLTLISAFLLLNKPRKSSQIRIPESAAKVGV